MKTFEIYFKDLTKEAQKRFLKHFNIKEEDMNHEPMPIAIIDMETEDEI